MAPKILPLCRFHLHRLLRHSPIALGVFAALTLVSLAALLGFFAQRQAIDEAGKLSFDLFNKVKAVPPAAAASVVRHPEFQEFNSTHLVAVLSKVAARAQLPLAEVTYRLDDNTNLPYLRYRAVLTVNANYLAIRGFIDGVVHDLIDVSLDNISCTREDLRSSKVNCELAFSAFYRKPHG